MRFTATRLAGAVLVDLEPLADERGFFARSWCAREFAAHGLDPALVQCNVSFNRAAGTLRGLHWQDAPHAEAKLVRCTRGRIHDVIVDVRPESPTFRQWLAVELAADAHTALYIPHGFAHGFQSLEDASEVLYHMSDSFHPECARGARFDDPAFAVEWPHAERRTVSAKDLAYPPFAATTP